jgi:transcriptional regulator with XRE-family HTH domain
MEFNILIKSIRKKQGLTQAEVARNIMSQSSYSKFEKGIRAISATELHKLTEKLKINATDLNDIHNLENNEIALIRSKIQAAIKQELPLKELEELYALTLKKKESSIYFYRSYLYIQKYFSHLSDKIPQVSHSEFEKIFQELKKSEYWTNYYVQIIMDFTTEFTTDQLIYILKRLEKYKITWASPIDSNLLQILPGALSNIADILIDASIKHTQTNYKLLTYANRACIKLQEILTIMPSIEYELLLKLSQIRYDFFNAKNYEEKEKALVKTKNFLLEIQGLAKIRKKNHEKLLSITEPIENSLKNIIEHGRCGNEILYYTF